VTVPRAPEPAAGQITDDLAGTDRLLDRLGRREPDPGDLGDPVVATLAALAGDVDEQPVPVVVTSLALAAGRRSGRRAGQRGAGISRPTSVREAAGSGSPGGLASAGRVPRPAGRRR
jgi:hypothetical protein